MADSSRTRTPNFTKPDGVALREYLETRIAAQQDYFSMRLDAVEKATALAATALEKRLEGMNEFREAMGDLSAKMVTRTEMDIQIDKLSGQIDDLKRSRDQLEGKASQKSADVALLFGVGGTVIGIAGLLLHILTM